MRRPSRLSTTGVVFAQNFDSGELSYDGAGNIRAMGADVFLYDKLSRLKDSTVRLPSWAGGTARSQGYTFDDFGNISSVTGTNARTTPTSSSTNRLTGAGVSYAAAGNLTCWGGTFVCNGTTYQYDRLNRLQRMTTAAGPAQEDWAYVYTADDERFWSLKVNGSGSLWSLRDLSGSPVRQFQAHLGWSKTKDSIFRDGQLLAADHPDEGTRHYHLDHLGTPRLTTNPPAQMIAHHTYFPFGEEVAGSTTDGERLKFTGHERDLNNTGGAGDDLDYMHARFCSPVTGRFLSVDPADSRILELPQTLNRYAYSRNNPVRLVDPDGRQEVVTVPAPAHFDPVAAIKSFFNNLGNSLANSGHVLLVEDQKRDQMQQTAQAVAVVGAVAVAVAVISRKDLPADAQKAVAEIDSGADRPNVVNPAAYKNDGRKGSQQLPTRDEQGNPITYTKHTVNPREPNQPHDARRIVIGSDGKRYYTDDHYRTFKLIEPETK